MTSFHPTKIFLDPSVQHLPKTQLILKKLEGVPVEIVTDKSQIKSPTDHTHAKKQLYLTRLNGAGLRPCQGIGDYLCCNYHTFALVSDCHLDCTYCILQDYLYNNPVITVHTNIEEILDSVSKQILVRAGSKPALDLGRVWNPPLRIGTGELSDSLALDDLTEFSKDLVPFANTHPNIVLELKTKTTRIENLLELKHNGNTVVAFSINPTTHIENEEFKCATLADRLSAARKCADKGYPIGLHLDPILFSHDWKKLYAQLIDNVAQVLSSNEIAWISMGTLRFTKGLKKITDERFPHSGIMTTELYPSSDGKTRMFRPLREEMYRHIKTLIANQLPNAPVYLCMETRTVWENVFGQVPGDNEEIHNSLVKRWHKSVDTR